MVLQELGSKLTTALQKMQRGTVISEEVLNQMLKDISAGTWRRKQLDISTNSCETGRG